MRWALLRPLRLCVIVCLTPRAANAVMKTAAFAAEEHERKASGTRTGTGPVGRDGHGGRPHHRHGCVSRSERDDARHRLGGAGLPGLGGGRRAFSIWRIDHRPNQEEDRKSTRLNSSHDQISYAVFCLKKKKTLRAAVRAEERGVFARIFRFIES